MRLSSQRLVRVFVLISLLALGLAACGEDTSDTTTTAPTTTAAATTTTTTAAAAATTTTTTAAAAATTTTAAGTATGGILQVGVLNDVTAWDSSRLQGNLFPFHRNLYDTLADYENGLNPVPMLATGWEISDAQDSVTITLREGVLFHSGREMMAEDIAANLAVFSDGELGNQAFGPTSGAVNDWEVTGPYELVVNFHQPIAALQITDLLTGWAIGDPEFFDVYATEANGTGPFKMGEWVPGESVTLEAHTDYWGEGPFIDGIEYRIFGDADAMAAAIEAGDIDVMYNPSATVANRLAGLGFTTVTAPPGAIIDQLRINPTVPPFDNVDMRLALSYATDMEAINEALYSGLGTVVRLPYAPTSPAYDAELAATLSFDLDKAREHLEASGVPESEWKAVFLTASNSQDQQLAAQILQQTLAEIGWESSLDLVDNATRGERYFDGTFTVIWSGIGNAQKYPTRITTNSIYRHQDNPIFDISLIPGYTEAVLAANAAVTEADQAARFDDLNNVMANNLWVVSGIARPQLTSTASYVKGAYKDIDSQDRFQLVRIER